MNYNTEELINFISAGYMAEIKVNGTQSDRFVKLSMVVINDRILAKVRGIDKGQWHDNLLTNPSGQIMCADHIYAFKARPFLFAELYQQVEEAYWAKENLWGFNAEEDTDQLPKEVRIMEFDVL